MSVSSSHEIYFIRHGQTDWNHQRRLQGQTDIALNDTGHRQAAAIADALQNQLPDISGHSLYCSTMERARQTMDAILRKYGLTTSSVQYDDRLVEKSFGIYEGKTWPELNAIGIDPDIDPQRFYNWQPPQGENHPDVTARISEWMHSLTGPVIVVSHGVVSRLLRASYLDIPPKEAISLSVPQDKFFRLKSGRIDWFDAPQIAA